jgi:hypothetical protein
MWHAWDRSEVNHCFGMCLMDNGKVVPVLN